MFQWGKMEATLSAGSLYHPHFLSPEWAWFPQFVFNDSEVRHSCFCPSLWHRGKTSSFSSSILLLRILPLLTGVCCPLLGLTCNNFTEHIAVSRSDLHLRHQQQCNAETRAATEGRTGSEALRRRSSTRRLSAVESQAHSLITTLVASGLNPDRRSQCQSDSATRCTGSHRQQREAARDTGCVSTKMSGRDSTK